MRPTTPGETTRGCGRRCEPHRPGASCSGPHPLLSQTPGPLAPRAGTPDHRSARPPRRRRTHPRRARPAATRQRYGIAGPGTGAGPFPGPARSPSTTPTAWSPATPAPWPRSSSHWWPPSPGSSARRPNSAAVASDLQSSSGHGTARPETRPGRDRAWVTSRRQGEDLPGELVRSLLGHDVAAALVPDRRAVQDQRLPPLELPSRNAMSLVPHAISTFADDSAARRSHSACSQPLDPMISRGKTALPVRSSGVPSGSR